MVGNGEDVDATLRGVGQELGGSKGAIRCIAVRVQVVYHFTALYVLGKIRKVS